MNATPHKDIRDLHVAGGDVATLLADNSPALVPYVPETAAVTPPAEMNAAIVAASREKRIQFYKPSELRAYQPDDNTIIAGDAHITRGQVFVIGGEPGVGKSTAATELAFCGVDRSNWLGIPIHCQFKTMIIQTENGRYRLKKEYEARNCGSNVDDFILVSEPPPYGLTLNHPEFLYDIGLAIDGFRPDVVILDPWNSAAKDNTQRDYLEAFDHLRAMLPKGKDKPALGIVAHTRKPKSDEKRTGGTALMHLLSGSYALSSVARSVFIVTPGAFDETDNSVVWFNPKNNDGEKIGRTAWERSPSGFKPIQDFDWATFDGGDDKRRIIEANDIRQAFNGEELIHSVAVKALEAVTGLGRRACEKALNPKGKFASILSTDPQGFIAVANE